MAEETSESWTITQNEIKSLTFSVSDVHIEKGKSLFFYLLFSKSLPYKSAFSQNLNKPFPGEF